MRTRVAFFFLISCLSLNIVLSYPWSTSGKIQSNLSITNCSTTEDNMRAILLNVTIDPPDLKKGTKITIKGEIDLKEEVTSGEVKVSLNYGEINILNKILDLCDLLTQLNKQCPLKKNKITISFDEKAIPDYMPSGKYKGRTTVSDQHGLNLICLEMSVDL